MESRTRAADRVTAGAQSLPPLTRIALVAIFAAIVCARMPDVLIHGRLWAEEGRYFYVRAATLSWWRALTFSFGGYLNVVANAAPMIARQVLPLRDVPWFTTTVGLLFQCCPAILLVCSRDDWLRSRWSRTAALLLIATPPLVEEVWLQTLHSQFHLALCSALVLALDVPRRRLAMFGLVVLFLAPLCGPSAWLLPPLFAARAVLERSRMRAMQAAVLGTGTLLQLAFFYVHVPGRSYGISPVVLACVIWIKQVVVPFAGRGVGAVASASVQATLAAGHVPWRPVLVVIVLLVALAVAVIRRRHPACTWLCLAAISLGGAGYFGAIDGGVRLLIIGNVGRYSFLPEVLAALILLVIATGTRRPNKWAARAGVAWLIAIGIRDVATDSPNVEQGPDWLAEVSVWQHDHAHPIAIWPRGWTMQINAE